MIRKQMTMLFTVLLGTFFSGAGTLSAQGPREGIVVHGHWEIEVHNPDGTRVSRQEFENRLLLSGAGALSQILSRTATAGEWMVTLGTFVGPNFSNDFGSTAPFVTLWESTRVGAIGGSDSKNLTVTPAFGGIVLKGSATSTSAAQTTFPQVRTTITKCAPSVAPADCTGLATYNSQTWSDFSGTNLPTPLVLQPEQIVQVTVTISFTSPPPSS